MAVDLKQRIREHGRRDRRDAYFSERLLEVALRIERDFHGAERARLLALTGEAFDRHLAQRDSSLRIRERLAKLKADQELLGELFALLATRPPGGVLH